MSNGNVYDSPTGRILLVPQGSRLIADYDDQAGFGQRRGGSLPIRILK
jgi:type IV secretion system protein VirB10